MLTTRLLISDRYVHEKSNKPDSLESVHGRFALRSCESKRFAINYIYFDSEAESDVMKYEVQVSTFSL